MAAASDNFSTQAGIALIFDRPGARLDGARLQPHGSGQQWPAMASDGQQSIAAVSCPALALTANGSDQTMAELSGVQFSHIKPNR